MIESTTCTKAEIERFKGIDILGAPQFDKEMLMTVMKVAAKYEQCLAEGNRLYDMDGKVMAALFFEPSTRTRLSFTTAMHRLGGHVITVADAKTSSGKKGETWHDTMKINDSYADVLVCRHPEEGSAEVAAAACEHPVLNGGDGAGQHPSQALLDIYTIFKEKGSPEGLTVALVGDLKYGRTVHSLVDFLAFFKCKVILAAPKELEMPAEIVADMKKKGVDVEHREGMENAVKGADVIYMTRVQGERFADQAEYERIKGAYIMDGKIVKKLKEGAIIMHPLPRIVEITTEVDDYKGAAYFREAANGLFVRMALIALVTGNVRFETK